jgi:chemotaxis protein histidine kinase CheA
MAGAMTMGNLGHHTESLLGEAESGRVDADSQLMDLLDEVHDALVTMIGQMQYHKPVSVFATTSAKVLARLGHAPAPAAHTPVVAGAAPNRLSQTARPRRRSQIVRPCRPPTVRCTAQHEAAM